MALAHAAWAARQYCSSPLTRLVLLRLAEGYADCAGNVRFDPVELSPFCCATPAVIEMAFRNLVDEGLIRPGEHGWRLPLDELP